MYRARLLGAAVIILLGTLLTPITGTLPTSSAATDTLLESGFESGGLSYWPIAEGVAVQDRLVRNGSWTARASSSGERAFLRRGLGSAYPALTSAFGFNVASMGANSVRLSTLRRSGGAAMGLFVTRRGELAIRNFVKGATLVSNRLVDDGAWHRVRLTVHVAGGDSSTRVRLDGSPVAALTRTARLGSRGIRAIGLGETRTGRRFDVAYDDVRVGSATSPETLKSPDPVIAAAGDIACDPADGAYQEGAGTSTRCRQKAVSDLLTSQSVDHVLTLGDNQYEKASLSDFQASYDPSWGRVKAKTSPVPGNHEYYTSAAAGYFDYFGSAAGARAKGYYSFDVGAWHVVALNSNCSKVGGCGEGSAQNDWLEADLAASNAQCTLAYWHHPRFSSGEHGNTSSVGPFWTDLYAAGADVVLGGHDHDYERFAQLDPSGSPDAGGIRQFVVGTGGKNHYGFQSILPTSRARTSDTFGVLQLTLRPTRYAWEFVSEGPQSFDDSGSTRCR